MFETKIPKDINQGGFATMEDVKKACAKVDYVKHEAEAAGVSVMSDGKVSYVLDDDGFYFSIGGTGSKKTRDVVAPYIYNNAIAGNSMIITDIKGDLYKLMSPMLRKENYRIRVLNFNEPQKGDAYNPIAPIYREYKNGRKDQANRALNHIADMIFQIVKSDKDPFWHTVSASYFTGCELTLFDAFDESQATLANALNMHIQGLKKIGGTTYIKSYYEDNENTEAWKLMVSTVEAPNDTRNSIHAVYTSALNKLIGQNNSLIKMTSHSTFEIEDLVEEKTALFIISNEGSLSVHSFLITALLQQWYDILINLADRGNGVLKRNVVFVLDEFGNLPAIPDFQTKISLSRARGISWMIVLQSFAQLEYRYGKDVAKTIIGNTANWIYLFSPDLETLKYMSELCGEVIDEYTGLQSRLLSVNQLRHFEKSNDEGCTECLMLLGRMKPFVSYLPDISLYYGVEPLEMLDIPEREEENVPELDFCTVVEQMRRERLLKKVDEEAKRRAEEKQKEEKQKKEKRREENSLREVVDKVVEELVGGKA